MTTARTNTLVVQDDAALHQTTLYQYEDAVPTHGETTWWGWTCATCGDGKDGLGPTFAEDLARVHVERTAPCACGNPTITDLRTFPSGSHRVSCDCGLSEVVYERRDDARRVLARHSCLFFAGHAHNHPTPAYRMRPLGPVR